MASHSLSDFIKHPTIYTSLQLRANSLNGDLCKSIGEILGSPSKINSLHLQKNKLKDDSFKFIVDGLKRNTTLTELTLSECRLHDKAIRSLSEALRLNEFLTTVDLRGNKFEDDGLKHLCDCLKQNQTVTALNLADNKITEKGIKHIISCLCINACITTLELQNNSIGDLGAENIATCFRLNNTLTSLNVEGNHIKMRGSVALAEILSFSESIVSLSMGHNCSSDAVMVSIARGLIDNKSITYLGLDREKSAERRWLNVLADGGVERKSSMEGRSSRTGSIDGSIPAADRITDGSAEMLGRSLSRNKTLTMLSLKGNNISDVGAMVLLAGLRESPHMINLCLENNRVSQDLLILVSQTCHGHQEDKESMVHSERLRNIRSLSTSNTTDQNRLFVRRSEFLPHSGAFSMKKINTDQVNLDHTELHLTLKDQTVSTSDLDRLLASKLHLIEEQMKHEEIMINAKNERQRALASLEAELLRLAEIRKNEREEILVLGSKVNRSAEIRAQLEAETRLISERIDQLNPTPRGIRSFSSSSVDRYSRQIVDVEHTKY
ncbi:hypothetical protein PROFUN_02255 [Planoprotostelium fungivorum]|uniref:Uncharacterized protein n=1 Tax=Planoprotostelium fungivorum TaxID=1890364 RepID=A0A2P6NYE6_9EUKA|nr:hypothetical protein PROFUN_02255 [Planoprotostelium fungivorum]